MEKGPIYGVELLETLPLGPGGFRQQMASLDDLKAIAKKHPRIVAAYEILTASFQGMLAERNEAREAAKECWLSVSCATVHHRKQEQHTGSSECIAMQNMLDKWPWLKDEVA